MTVHNSRSDFSYNYIGNLRKLRQCILYIVSGDRNLYETAAPLLDIMGKVYISSPSIKKISDLSFEANN